MTGLLVGELASYAKHSFSAANALALVEHKREVMVALLEDVEIRTPQLREAFYESGLGGRPASPFYPKQSSKILHRAMSRFAAFWPAPFYKTLYTQLMHGHPGEPKRLSVAVLRHGLGLSTIRRWLMASIVPWLLPSSWPNELSPMSVVSRVSYLRMVSKTRDANPVIPRIG
ncbi:hypothetical protein GCM10007880_63010 [Mesorhizobium amorphae]|nr:hypothetical protein GCM10007880_63010 [Mesorhizobium amorphae]